MALGTFTYIRVLLPNLKHEKVYIALIILAGVIGRMAWLAFVNKDLTVAGGEAQNVAASVFRDLSVADAFGRGSGLTAHVNPILPIVAGLLYRTFGWGSPAAELILLSFSFIFVFGAAVIFYDCFKRLGVSTFGCLTGLAMFCLLPINLRHEVVMFRIWEGGLAALILAFGLRQLIILDGNSSFTRRDKIIFALTAAFGLFVNPAAGLTLYVAGAVFMIRNMSIKNAATTIALSTGILVAVLAPWTIRNMIAFDRFVPLRSNYGLEIALANHPGIQSGQSDPEIFTERWKEIHPFATQEAFERMQRAGGEQSYTAKLGEEAKVWMWQHPALTTRLAAKHVAQFYFPPTWQFELWGGANRGAHFTVYTYATLSLVALISSVLLMFLRGGSWIYPFLFLVVPSLPYALVQPTPRYHYLISTLSIYLAVSIFLIVRGGMLTGSARSSPRRLG